MSASTETSKTIYFPFVPNEKLMLLVVQIFKHARISRSVLQLLPFNPIALRKAQIVYNFGLSECNRVKCIMLIYCVTAHLV